MSSKTQEEFDDVYDLWRAMTRAGVDHIDSPCSPLKKYRKNLLKELLKDKDFVGKAQESEKRDIDF
jgi:hypothetical protein